MKVLMKVIERKLFIMKVLVTGFEPFDGEPLNPALEAVNKLPSEIAEAEIIKAVIPVVFSKAGKVLADEIEKWRPDIVLCVGQAGGDPVISVERVAINIMDARIPDNEGCQPVDVPVDSDGENAYFASLPIKAIVSSMNQAGVPAQLSFSAGSFVCNALMYHLLYLIDKKYPQMKGGFIHVPYAPQQAAVKGNGIPSMHIDDMVRGLTAAIKTAVTEEEISIPMGTLQ
ncbi:MAG: pyroglutamyl-peptidase I [Anaerovoracaceae bacterium]